MTKTAWSICVKVCLCILSRSLAKHLGLMCTAGKTLSLVLQDLRYKSLAYFAFGGGVGWVGVVGYRPVLKFSLGQVQQNNSGSVDV